MPFSIPATALPVAFTAPQDQYRDSSENGVDDFYQHLDHKLVLLSASIGEPGHDPGFPE